MALIYFEAKNCSNPNESYLFVLDELDFSGEIEVWRDDLMLFHYNNACWVYFATHTPSEVEKAAYTPQGAGFLTPLSADCSACLDNSTDYYRLVDCNAPGSYLNIEVNSSLQDSVMLENIANGGYFVQIASICYVFDSLLASDPGDAIDTITNTDYFTGKLYFSCYECTNSSAASYETYRYITISICNNPTSILNVRFDAFIGSPQIDDFSLGVISIKIAGVCYTFLSESRYDQVDVSSYATLTNPSFFDDYGYADCDTCQYGDSTKYLELQNCDGNAANQLLRIATSSGENFDAEVTAGKSFYIDDNCWVAINYLSSVSIQEALSYTVRLKSEFDFYLDCSACGLAASNINNYLFKRCSDDVNILHLSVTDTAVVNSYNIYILNDFKFLYQGVCCYLEPVSYSATINNLIVLSGQYSDCITCEAGIIKGYIAIDCEAVTNIEFKSADSNIFDLWLGKSIRFDGNSYDLSESSSNIDDIIVAKVWSDVEKAANNCELCDETDLYGYKETNCFTGAESFYKATLSASSVFARKGTDCFVLTLIESSLVLTSWTTQEQSYYDSLVETNCESCLTSLYKAYTLTHCVTGLVIVFASSDIISFDAAVSGNKILKYYGECYSIEVLEANYSDIMDLLSNYFINYSEVTAFDSCGLCAVVVLTHTIYSATNCSTGKTFKFKSTDDFSSLLFGLITIGPDDICYHLFTDVTEGHTQEQVDLLTDYGLSDFTSKTGCYDCRNAYFKLINCFDASITYIRSSEEGFYNLADNEIIFNIGSDCFSIEYYDGVPGALEATVYSDIDFVYDDCISCQENGLSVKFEKRGCDKFCVTDSSSGAVEITMVIKLYKINFDLSEKLVSTVTEEREGDWLYCLSLPDGHYRVEVSNQAETIVTKYDVSSYCAFFSCQESLLNKLWCEDGGDNLRVRKYLADMAILLDILETPDLSKITDPLTGMTKYGWTIEQIQIKYEQLLAICYECTKF